MGKVVNLKAAKKQRGTYRYASMVLDAFDRLSPLFSKQEAADRRERLDRSAEVRRKAKDAI